MTPNMSTAYCEKSARPYVLAATILGSSMAFIDGTVVNVALPALQSAFHATAIDVQWVIESYALFLAALLLVGGSLGDHFGRRRIFSTGVALFTLASIWCGLAPNVTHLIAARAVQGIGGAMLVPGSLAIISASFPKEERGKAIGTWSGFTSITAAIGPVMGGWLIEHVSWRAVFFLNVPSPSPFSRSPIDMSARVAMTKPRANSTGSARFSRTVSLGALVYGLIESSSRGFLNAMVLSALIIGVIASILFFVVEARNKNPMLPLALFRSMDFSGANLLTFLLYAALSGMLYFLPPGSNPGATIFRDDCGRGAAALDSDDFHDVALVGWARRALRRAPAADHRSDDHCGGFRALYHGRMQTQITGRCFSPRSLCLASAWRSVLRHSPPP